MAELDVHGGQNQLGRHDDGEYHQRHEKPPQFELKTGESVSDDQAGHRLQNCHQDREQQGIAQGFPVIGQPHGDIEILKREVAWDKNDRVVENIPPLHERLGNHHQNGIENHKAEAEEKHSLDDPLYTLSRQLPGPCGRPGADGNFVC